MKSHSIDRPPIIGILANIETINYEPFLGCERSCVNQNYIDAIVKAGGVPLMLPVIQDTSLIDQQMELIDGLMLTGGYDVHPLLYGEEPHPDLGFINLLRDRFELDAIAIAYEQRKPIFGICRGSQIINIAFGGTLYQDLGQLNEKNKVKHSQKAPLHTPFHTVDIIPSTTLHNVFNKSSIETNSFHHQAIKDIADGFVVNAKARDGIIEGIEKKDYPFLLGVQWHPERMVDHYPAMLELFKIFVNHAKSYQLQHSS